MGAASTDPALAADGAGNVLSSNAAADHAAGCPLAGRNLLDLLPEPSRPHWLAFQHHVHGGGDAPLRIPVLSADGRGVEVEVHVQTVGVRSRGLLARACQLI